MGARWLPDGRIISVGNEPGHPERTYVIDLNGNEAPLTDEGVRAVASDGKRLLVTDADSSKYQFFSLGSRELQPVTQLQKGD